MHAIMGSRSWRTGLVLVTGLALAACGGEGTIGNRVSADVSGTADDGDSATPPSPQRYPTGLTATDSETRSASTNRTANRVNGNAHAVPTDPTAQTLTNDQAIATSNNSTKSVFTVTKAGNFTFDIDLDIDDVDLIHDGRAYISVRANMLSATGTTLPPNVNSGLASVDLEFKPSAGNPLDVIINADNLNPDQAEADGDYNPTISGPNGGITLAIGAYQLELSLTIEVTAPIQFGPDGRKHEAHVPNATATITIR